MELGPLPGSQAGKLGDRPWHQRYINVMWRIRAWLGRAAWADVRSGEFTPYSDIVLVAGVADVVLW